MAPRPMPASVQYRHKQQLSARVRTFAGWLRVVFAAA